MLLAKKNHRAKKVLSPNFQNQNGTWATWGKTFSELGLAILLTSAINGRKQKISKVFSIAKDCNVEVSFIKKNKFTQGKYLFATEELTCFAIR